MINQLYQKAILRHAANATASGVLEEPHATHTLNNPLCGDRITVHIRVRDGKIIDFRHETRACVLCQASASLIGEHFQGLSENDIRTLYEQLKEGLRSSELENKKDWPDAKWASLEIFQPVSGHINRHGCVTLPFEALLDALKDNISAQ